MLCAEQSSQISEISDEMEFLEIFFLSYAIFVFLAIYQLSAQLYLSTVLATGVEPFSEVIRTVYFTICFYFHDFSLFFFSRPFYLKFLTQLNQNCTRN
jgi:hypothetical protein